MNFSHLKNREQDRDLFPKFVIVGWDGVLDSDGEPVEFTKENCADLLAALPDWFRAGNVVN